MMLHSEKRSPPQSKLKPPETHSLLSRSFLLANANKITVTNGKGILPPNRQGETEFPELSTERTSILLSREPASPFIEMINIKKLRRIGLGNGEVVIEEIDGIAYARSSDGVRQPLTDGNPLVLRNSLDNTRLINKKALQVAGAGVQKEVHAVVLLKKDTENGEYYIFIEHVHPEGTTELKLMNQKTATIPQMEASALSAQAEREDSLINHDAHVIDVQNGIFIVADGNGQNPESQKAAKILTDIVHNRLKNTDLTHLSAEQLKSLVENFCTMGRQEIALLPGAMDKDAQIGTTLLVAVIRNGRVYYANVGDSRLYHMTKGGLSLVTRDHSNFFAVIENYFRNKPDGQIIAGDIMDRWLRILNSARTGDTAITLLKILLDENDLIYKNDSDPTHEPEGVFWYKRNQISNTVTARKDIVLHVSAGSFSLENGDRLLLTTDGIPMNLTDQEIAYVLRSEENPQLNLLSVCYWLLKSAKQRAAQIGTNERSHPDDMTDIVVEIKDLANAA